MIDPERLIGGLLFGGLGKGFMKLDKKKRKGGGSFLDGAFGSTTKTAIGMGALGVGIAAFEHFMSQRQTSPSVAAPSTVYAPPPPPPAPSGFGTTPPPPPPPARSSQTTGDGILLIRAAIAAANADGAIDAGEREKILQQLESIGINAEERAFLAAEFLSPATLEGIASQVHTPELAEQVYAISLLTLEVDTEAEKKYLNDLKVHLKLSDSDIQRIQSLLGVE